MKIRYNATQAASFEAEVPGVMDAFRFISYCDDVFGIPECGQCHAPKDELRLVHRRTKEGYDYHSVECKKCHYSFKFGVTQTNPPRLFPRTKDGWVEPYRGGNAKDASDNAPQQQQSQSAPSDSGEQIPW